MSGGKAIGARIISGLGRGGLLLALVSCHVRGLGDEPFEPRCAGVDPGPRRLTKEVDPFIGTAAHGHTFPGATRPFGMVQPSPDTRLEGWDGCSGYHYDDSVVYGFSQTHLSGTGIADYADVLLMPTRRGLAPDPAIGDPEHPFAARFSHDQERAEPGYYYVWLDRPKIEVELTATPRVAVHRYHFVDGGEPAVLLDLRHRDETIEAWVEMVSTTELVGLRRSRGWARDQRVYFAIRLSRPITTVETVGASAAVGPGSRRWEGPDVRLQLDVVPDEAPLQIKVAISAVDVDGARANLDAEATHWDFDAYRQEARDDWERALSAMEIEGGDPSRRRVFYTALYHSMLAPNLFEDVDGRYRGTDHQIHESPDFTVYTVFSLWDTFRATHPLLTILEPERTRDFVSTLLSHATWGGRLSMWELWGNYTGTMIGYHAVPVIVDAWVKGIRGFDGELALRYAIESADADRLGLPGYREHGYVPAEQEHESVSKTLEYAYDDWCIAQLADDLGHTRERDRFLRRAQHWENLFDPEHGLFRAREQGAFVPDFDPREVNLHYTEANAWQYGFFVPHDVGGLVARHGGPQSLEARLDRLFSEPSALSGRDQVDITGLIGQYAQGNEPSHHAAYLYPFVGQAPKTQARVRQILDTLYTDAPDGLSGNDDCGQMSSWYVLSALGFYPLAPGSDQYVIGSPRFPRATIHLPGGQDFVVEAEGLADDAPYVQRATLDGRPHESALLRHGDIVGGGHLVLHMGTAPNPGWGAIEPEPPLHDGAASLLPTPLVHAAAASFVGTTTVELSRPWGQAELRYRLDGQPPTLDSPRYEGPITLDRTTTITAAAFEGERRGPWVTATFYGRSPELQVTLGAEPNRSYRAGGPEGLIDGRRGTEHWRTGAWQGYQGADFEATVDLGRTRSIRRVEVGFLQDANAWIWMPQRLEVEVSRDGQRWRSLGTAEHEVPTTDVGRVYLQPLVVEAKPTKVRYVRVRAPSFGTIPDWHPGRGHPSFVFVDEVVVQ